MKSNENIIRELYLIQFRFKVNIEIEYWSGYNKTLKKIDNILNSQNIICSYHLYFLLRSLDNFYKHDFIAKQDYIYFKSLIERLGNIETTT